ncbi:MAG: MerR family transcriptional regulator [Deltaproteobacteria bacterium]|nr:MerR family transcriptional regulator [Deltaproteobacteria bacterium]
MENERPVSINEAARICEVTVKQIRNWEARNYIPMAVRIKCGERSYRQFAQSDLDLICKIKSYLKEGFNLSTAAKRAASDISTRKEEESHGKIR